MTHEPPPTAPAPRLDDTHDPAVTSWVASANAPGTDFPVQNLPYGRFRRTGTAEPWRIGVAIGDEVLDLHAAAGAVAWDPEVARLLAPLAAGDLNALMAEPSALRQRMRGALSDALRTGSPHQGALAPCLVPMGEATLTVPCHIGDYTDFYAGIHHATAVGKLFRPDQPLLPNYKWVPIGYHGRASSIVASGQAFHRPVGQTRAPNTEVPTVGPARRLDHELELGWFVGTPNALGEPVGLAEAESHLFGLALLNDWSARDVQAWEYQPLGPFLAKSFATTVSPWVVTLEALAPFRAPLVRPEGDPAPLPYLDTPFNRESGAVDVQLEVWLETAAMRARGEAPFRLSRSNAREAYWTPAQQLTHHTMNGCNLRPGDLLGSGTLSGARPEEAGSLLELSAGGSAPVALPNGETRTFLEDGDTVILRGFCERSGARRIGLGECRGTVLPAR